MGLISRVILPKEWVKEKQLLALKCTNQAISVSLAFLLISNSSLGWLQEIGKILRKDRSLDLIPYKQRAKEFWQNCCSQKVDFAFEVLVCSVFKVRHLHSSNSSTGTSIIWYNGFISFGLKKVFHKILLYSVIKSSANMFSRICQVNNPCYLQLSGLTGLM